MVSKTNSREEIRASCELKSKLFKALASPARLSIVECIARTGGRSMQEVSVGEILDHVEIAPANLSQHLNVLRNAGLVISRKEGTFVWCRLGNRKLLKVLELATEVCQSDLRESLALLVDRAS